MPIRSMQTQSIKNHYEALEIGPEATETEIREAFFRKARTCHPDVAKDPNATKKFLEIKEAYSTLSNPEKRLQYDDIFAGSLNNASRIPLDRQTREEEKRALEKLKEDLAVKMEIRQQINPRVWKHKDEKSTLSYPKKLRTTSQILQRSGATISPSTQKIQDFFAQFKETESQVETRLDRTILILIFSGFVIGMAYLTTFQSPYVRPGTAKDVKLKKQFESANSQ